MIAIEFVVLLIVAVGGYLLLSAYLDHRFQRLTNESNSRSEQLKPEAIAAKAADIAANIVFNKLDKDCRCPKCKGVVRPGSVFCKNCGERFATATQTKIGARILSVDEYENEIAWECLGCKEELFDDVPNKFPSIVRLKCPVCEQLVADLVMKSQSMFSLIEPGTTSLDQIIQNKYTEMSSKPKKMDIGLSSD